MTRNEENEYVKESKEKKYSETKTRECNRSMKKGSTDTPMPYNCKGRKTWNSVSSRESIFYVYLREVGLLTTNPEMVLTQSYFQNIKNVCIFGYVIIRMIFWKCRI